MKKTNLLLGAATLAAAAWWTKRRKPRNNVAPAGAVASEKPGVTLLLGAGFSQGLGVAGTATLSSHIDAVLSAGAHASTYVALKARLETRFGTRYNFEVLVAALESARVFGRPSLLPGAPDYASVIPEIADLRDDLSVDAADAMFQVVMGIIDAEIGKDFASRLSAAQRTQMIAFFNALRDKWQLNIGTLNYDHGEAQGHDCTARAKHVTRPYVRGAMIFRRCEVVSFHDTRSPVSDRGRCRFIDIRHVHVLIRTDCRPMETDIDETLDVSVVICTRNRASRLDGVLRALNAIETVHSWEVVFVDNVSTDATAEVIASAANCGGRLRYVRCERIGSGAARDAGWRQARGRIIVSVDDDCYPAPDYIDAIVDVFRRFPNLGCVGGRIVLHDPLDARATIDERSVAVEYPPRTFIEGGEIQGANLAIRRSVLADIGGYDSDFGAGTRFPCEDIDIVAAALWSGAPARYDPVPIVAHHHRRRQADVPALERYYDAGRGAYYAKYLLRRDTRRAYLLALARLALNHSSLHDLRRLTRELGNGAAYLVNRRAYAFTAAAVPVGALWWAAVAVIVGVRVLSRRRPWSSTGLFEPDRTR